MSNNALNNMEVGLICRNCGTQHNKPISWLRDHADLACECCGFHIALLNEQLQDSIEEFADVMERLSQSYTRRKATNDPLTSARHSAEINLSSFARTIFYLQRG